MNLPKNQDAELQVVGGMIVDPSQVVPVLEVLDEEHFAYASCRAIFTAVKTLAGRGRDVDAVSVKEQLKGDVSAQERLVEAITGTMMPGHAVHHAEMVRELAGLRGIINVGQSMIDLGATPDIRFPDAIAEAERGVFSLSTNGYHRADWMQATSDALDRLEYRHTTDQVVTGIPTGLQALDQRLTGLHPGWLVVIGARPGEGKTSLALQIALHAAEAGTKAMMVSLEMSAVELATRAICARADISYTKVRRSTLQSSDWQRFVKAQGELAEMPLELYDEGIETVAQITSRVRRSKPGLLVVDYIQLMRPDVLQARRDLDVAEITRGLKLLAKSAQMPVIACAQLNRSLEKRESRTPQMSDLRESGAQEQDADVVYLIHRKEKDPRMVDAICAKFRHGPTGTDSLRWYADITKFADGWV